VLISIVIVFLSLFFKLIFGGAKAKVEKKKPETAAETSTSEAKTEEKAEAVAAPRKRQTRRES
jgi:calnexin